MDLETMNAKNAKLNLSQPDPGTSPAQSVEIRQAPAFMTFKEVITGCCASYARQDSKVRYIGYNTVFGSRMYETLSCVPREQCIETPVCENLMVGLALGMSLEGYKPVVCFERHDFMLIAMDALVNHFDKLPYLSGGQYGFPVIVRAIVGSRSPLNPGPQHTKDYSDVLRDILDSVQVLEPDSAEEYAIYWRAITAGTVSPVVIIEHKDWYSLERSPRTI